MKKYFKFLLVLLIFACTLLSGCSLTKGLFGSEEGGTINAKYGLSVNEVADFDNINDSDVATTVANIVMPATVEIRADITYSYTYSFGGFMGYSSRTVTDKISSVATAFFINGDGYLMTNAHVVSIENESSYKDLKYINRTLKINYADSNATFEVEVIDYDATLDLAILKLKEGTTIENLKYVTFFNMTSPNSEEFESEDAVKLYYGEICVAIGNANGYGISVTKGVVSAPYRNFTSSGITTAAIQTDAAINEGNSGGPLANKYGAVIGINSFKTVTSTSESLGFAIPSYVAMKYIEYVANNKNLTINYYCTALRAYTK